MSTFSLIGLERLFASPQRAIAPEPTNGTAFLPGSPGEIVADRFRSSQARFATVLQATRVSVNIRIEQQSITTFREELPMPGGAGDSIPESRGRGALISRLDSLDTRLAEQFEVLVDLVENINPDAARFFERALHVVLDFLDGSRTGPLTPIPVSSMGPPLSPPGRAVGPPAIPLGEAVGPVDGLPGRRVGPPEGLPGRRVGPPDGLPGRRVGPPEGLPGQKVGPPVETTVETPTITPVETAVEPTMDFEIRQQSFQVAIQASITDIRVEIADRNRITVQMVQVSLRARLAQALGLVDPLVLDLNDNGLFDTTTAAGGHEFDILGSGRNVQTATTTAGDGLLVFDRNGNGRVDDGTELFGDQNGAVDGFAELAGYDSNGDGRIDSDDPIFDRLGIFRDANLNGLTDVGELQGLSDFRIASLLLAAKKTDEDSNGNRVTSKSSFVRDDGTEGLIGDLLLNYLV